MPTALLPYITLYQCSLGCISVSISMLRSLKQVVCGVMKASMELCVIPLGASIYTERVSYHVNLCYIQCIIFAVHTKKSTILVQS